MDSVNFTKSAIGKLTPQNRAYYVYDRGNPKSVPSLLICVSPKGTKSFQVYRKFNGKPKRITLGKFPDLTIEQARKQARATILSLDNNVDPIKKKRADRSNGITLQQVFDDYMHDRRLSANTVSNYHSVMQVYFKSWLSTPLESITRDMIAKKHRDSSKHSEYGANKAMRVLRSLFNYAKEEYLDEDGHSRFPDNPVNQLSHKKIWNREERRSGRILPHQFPAWFEGISQLEPLARDYLTLVLLTGLRRREAASLAWVDIDLEHRTLTVTDTKNREPLTLPLSTEIYALLEGRRMGSQSDFVFGTPNSASGHLEEPKKFLKKANEVTGIKFTLHDLRRTFVTIADSLDISRYAVKRLVNHKMGDDVTAGYIVADVERLRAPMQQITDVILAYANKEDSNAT